jgi:hypothetical protein
MRDPPPSFIDAQFHGVVGLGSALSIAACGIRNTPTLLLRASRVTRGFIRDDAMK